MSSQKISPIPSPKTIPGLYCPPPDKSITQRALILAALSRGRSRIQNPLATGDCLSTLQALKNLGVAVRAKKNLWEVRGGNLRPSSAPIDCGNSGTTMRLLSGLLSAQNFKSRLIGDPSLSRRPMARVIEPLTRMGARIAARQGRFAPLTVEGGHLKPVSWKMPMASAQVKSAILLAGLQTRGKTTVIEPARSRDHTERMLKAQGAKIHFNLNGPPGKANRISIEGPGALKPLHVAVPGDFSSAAFFISAALLVPGSKLQIQGVNLNPTRTGYLNVLKRMGARIRISNVRQESGEPVGNMEVRHSVLKGVSVGRREIALMIDEMPVLAVLATQARGKTVVSGAGELRVKESDRIHSVVSELKKMGASIQEKKDGWVIRGPAQMKGAAVQSYGDHRMAMSLAVAGLIASGKTVIRDFDCTKISYPDFLRDLEQILKPAPRDLEKISKPASRRWRYAGL